MLNRAERAELSEAALDNAHDLLMDAECLLAANRCPRAFALCVLAGEEWAKHLLLIASVNPVTGLGGLGLKDLREHRTKLAALIALLMKDKHEARRVVEVILGDFIRSLQDEKLKGLYVDAVRDGGAFRVSRPMDDITCDQAAGVVRTYGEAMRNHADWINDSGGVGALMERLERLSPDEVARLVSSGRDG